MKFRKKPVVIEADQWFPPADFRHKPIDGVISEQFHFGPADGTSPLTTRTVYGVRTLEGFMEAAPGDWIITGVKGEKYPCKPDIFEASYEPV